MLRDQNLLSNSLAQRRQARWNCCVFGWDVQTRGWLSGSATTFLGKRRERRQRTPSSVSERIALWASLENGTTVGGDGKTYDNRALLDEVPRSWSCR